jgi:hypothetical protein
MTHPPLRLSSAEIAVSLLMFTGQIEGMAIHFDTPIPPPSGPRRTLILHSRGTEELHSARLLYSRARDRLGCLTEHRLDSPHAPWWVYPPTATGVEPRCPYERVRSADTEVLARDALASAVRAFNLLEDLPEADDAHQLIHETGMFVSRHFGCKIRLVNGLWRWECPVIIAHLRLGQSIGYTAARICSICRESIMSERCPHMPNHLYSVVVEDTSRCPCGSRGCTDHELGTVIEVEPISLTEEADSLDEISWVARPRDPLARIEAICYSSEQIAILMGAEIPSGVRMIECLHCRQACTGLWNFETFGKLLKLRPSSQ